MEEFFTGPGATVLKPGELIRQIVIPRPGKTSGSAFKKLARVTLDIAKINCSVYLERKGAVCESVRDRRGFRGSDRGTGPGGSKKSCPESK